MRPLAPKRLSAEQEVLARGCSAEKEINPAWARPRLPLLLVLLLNVAFTTSAQPPAAYTNPVIAGDYPDPSVIRVGREFWATATSSEWAPQFPLLHSWDLVNWEVVGAVFRRGPSWSAGNYWAPEISQYRGRYFVYYAARKTNGPLCVAVATAVRPSGPYEDRGPLVCQEVGSIDAFPATDEQGKRYLLWKEDGNSVGKPTPIWAQQLSPDGSKLIGARHELLRNSASWEGQLIEGPAIVRHKGWFYLFYSGNACCGRDCNYALGVARSRKLLGPWEKNTGNPILAANKSWKCPGHGTVVQDAQGRFFLLYHAYHAIDSVYVGRQALLDEVKWDSQGWPTINDGTGPSRQAASPMLARKGSVRDAFFETFAGPGLLPGWQWPQADPPQVNLEVAGGGWVQLKPSLARGGDPVTAVLARSIVKGDYTATTLLDTGGLKAGVLSGLSAFGDGENALGASVGDGHLILWRREKKEYRILSAADIPTSEELYLRMTARQGHLYRFSFSVNERIWKDIGQELDGGFLPPWDRGVRVALVAGGAVAGGRFGWLRISSEKAQNLR